MADVQDDPHEELLWDQRALAAASSVTGGGAREYYPSLYLNLAEDYRKLGDWSHAREHLARAMELAGALPENGYGNMIRRGIAHLAGLPEFIGCLALRCSKLP
jgi:tetratricopeptide (TPR) repeat protein